MQKYLFGLLMGAVLVFGACGSNADNVWETNQKRIEQLAAKYPNLRATLQASLDSAVALRKAGLSRQYKSDRDEELYAANSLIDADYLLDLEKLEGKIQQLKNNLATQAGKIADKTASTELQNALTAAEEKLKTAKPADMSEIKALVEATTDELSAAQARLDKLVKAN